MAFFGDLLKGVNARLGYNADDPDRDDAAVNQKLAFSSKPRSHINLDMERKVEQTQDKKTKEEGSATKTSSKLKINHGDCTTTYTFANDKMAFEGKGTAVNDNDWKVDIYAGGEVKQVKEEWKISGGIDAAGKDLGGAKLNVNLPIESNQKNEITLKPKVNLEVADEINLGVSLKTDSKFTMKEIWPQLVYKPKDNPKSFYWARADMTRALLMLGCDQKLQDYVSHSFEAVVGWGKQQKTETERGNILEGIQGNPVKLRAGVAYELSDQTELSASGSWGKDYEVGMEVEHKVDKNWTISASQSFSSERVGASANQPQPYHIGFTATYKL